jgi:hypothetical protein
MQCHTCGSEVPLVRSVLIRQWLPEYREWGRSIPPPHPESAAYIQYQKNMEYRRGFICEKCYKKLDADPVGNAEIIGDGGPKEFNLAGKSRGDQAAIYDCPKWERFQRRAAEAMGITLQ